MVFPPIACEHITNVTTLVCSNTVCENAVCSNTVCENANLLTQNHLILCYTIAISVIYSRQTNLALKESDRIC